MKVVTVDDWCRRVVNRCIEKMASRDVKRSPCSRHGTKGMLLVVFGCGVSVQSGGFRRPWEEKGIGGHGTQQDEQGGDREDG